MPMSTNKRPLLIRYVGATSPIEPDLQGQIQDGQKRRRKSRSPRRRSASPHPETQGEPLVVTGHNFRPPAEGGHPTSPQRVRTRKSPEANKAAVDTPEVKSTRKVRKVKIHRKSPEIDKPEVKALRKLPEVDKPEVKPLRKSPEVDKPEVKALRKSPEIDKPEVKALRKSPEVDKPEVNPPRKSPEVKPPRKLPLIKPEVTTPEVSKPAPQRQKRSSSLPNPPNPSNRISQDQTNETAEQDTTTSAAETKKARRKSSDKPPNPATNRKEPAETGLPSRRSRSGSKDVFYQKLQPSPKFRENKTRSEILLDDLARKRVARREYYGNLVEERYIAHQQKHCKESGNCRSPRKHSVGSGGKLSETSDKKLSGSSGRKDSDTADKKRSVDAGRKDSESTDKKFPESDKKLSVDFGRKDSADSGSEEVGILDRKESAQFEWQSSETVRSVESDTSGKEHSAKLGKKSVNLGKKTGSPGKKSVNLGKKSVNLAKKQSAILAKKQSTNLGKQRGSREPIDLPFSVKKKSRISKLGPTRAHSLDSIFHKRGSGHSITSTYSAADLLKRMAPLPSVQSIHHHAAHGSLRTPMPASSQLSLFRAPRGSHTQRPSRLPESDPNNPRGLTRALTKQLEESQHYDEIYTQRRSIRLAKIKGQLEAKKKKAIPRKVDSSLSLVSRMGPSTSSYRPSHP